MGGISGPGFSAQDLRDAFDPLINKNKKNSLASRTEAIHSVFLAGDPNPDADDCTAVVLPELKDAFKDHPSPSQLAAFPHPGARFPLDCCCK